MGPFVPTARRIITLRASTVEEARLRSTNMKIPYLTSYVWHNVVSTPLDHHVYDQQLNQQIKHPSKYEHFEFHLSPPLNEIAIDAIAGTGCQSCLVWFRMV